MRIIKRMIIAFSLYSRIPMPVFEWDEKDHGHAVCFLPLVGIVIGTISCLVLKTGVLLGISTLPLVLILTAVPLIVTGGFHLDGFMDVQNARSSFADREKKLEIMKDPHIGAFAVIGLAVLGLIWTACLYTVVEMIVSTGASDLTAGYALIFFVGRSLCGLTSLLQKGAKKDGMLSREVSERGKGDIAFLTAQILIGTGILIAVNPLCGICMTVAGLCFVLYYSNMCKRNFGGVTGDTAGYFVVMSEAVMMAALAFFVLLTGVLAA